MSGGARKDFARFFILKDERAKIFELGGLYFELNFTRSMKRF